MNAIIKLTANNYRMTPQSIILRTAFGDVEIPLDKVSAKDDTILVPVECFMDRNMLPSDMVEGFGGVE